jgi:hypothetical protein
LDRTVTDLAFIQNQFAANPPSDSQAPKPDGAVELLLAARKQLALAKWLRERQTPKRGLLMPGLVLPPRPAWSRTTDALLQKR